MRFGFVTTSHQTTLNMNHTDFIVHLASLYRPNVYVELGLYQGETIGKVVNYCQTAIGVDIVNVSLHPPCIFKQMSTDQFFQELDHPVDMFFIDADHRYESVSKDFWNATQHLSPEGIIILHDTDPIEDALLDDGYCSNSYKIVRDIEASPQFNIITFPVAEAGVSVVTRKNSTRCFRRGL